MKLAIVNLQKKKMGERDLPLQFSEEYRPDLIRRAVLALQSAARQAYGAFPLAGLRHSYTVSKRRRDYRGCYGFGVSRVSRKILSRRGMRMGWVGAFSPQTRGGHRAHPPKAEKIYTQKVNKKENRKAIRSALAATVNAQLVAQRGHKVPVEYPFIVSADIEKIGKTKDVEAALDSLGFAAELTRAAIKKVRAGQGTLRGRRYQKKKGILLVVSETCPVITAAQNIPGIDIVIVENLNAELLAPGAMPGRITLWTEKAVASLGEKKLFI